MLTSRFLLLPLCGLLLTLAACSGSSNKNNTKAPPAPRQLTAAATFAASGALTAAPSAGVSPTGTEVASLTGSATPSDVSATPSVDNSGSATAAAGSQPSPSSSVATTVPAAAGTSAPSSASSGVQATTAPQSAAAVSTPAANSATASQSGQYTVAAGDTFVKIAAQLGISTQSLIDANPGIDADLLHPGQKLTLPTGGVAVSASTAAASRAAAPARTAAPASTATAARAALATATATAVRSSLPAGTATPASVVPAAPPVQRAPAATATASTAGGSAQAYTVQAGDTGCKIAVADGVSLQALADANGTTPSGLANLQIGQKLTIPASSGAAAGC